jgi:hypothetical protein
MMRKKIVFWMVMLLGLTAMAGRCDEYTDIKQRLACEKSAHKIKRPGWDQSNHVQSGFKVPANNGSNPQSLFSAAKKDKKVKIRLPHNRKSSTSTSHVGAKKPLDKKTSPADKSTHAHKSNKVPSGQSSVSTEQHFDSTQRVFAEAGIANAPMTAQSDFTDNGIHMPQVGEMTVSDQGFGTPGSVGDDVLYVQY